MISTNAASLDGDHAPALREGVLSPLSIGVSGLYLALYVHYGFFTFMPLWLKKTPGVVSDVTALLARV